MEIGNDRPTKKNIYDNNNDIKEQKKTIHMKYTKNIGIPMNNFYRENGKERERESKLENMSIHRMSRNRIYD